MENPKDMTEDDWVQVDVQLLACDADRAIRLVREITGAGPEDAGEIARRRFLLLREARPGDFAWNAFPCGDYLVSELAERGCWDEPSQYMIIEPAWGVRVRGDIGLLAVGGPGVDGIMFGYRKGHSGVWAYYPIEHECVHIAKTVQELADGWLCGKITV